MRGWLLATVVALFVATPLVPSEAVVHEGAGAALHLLWILCLVAWTGILLLRPGTSVALGWTAVAAAALILCCVASALIVGLAGNGRQSLNMLWQWVSYGVSAFLLRQLLWCAVQQRAVVVVMAGLAVVEAVEGYYEYFVSGPAIRAAFAADPESVYRQIGLTTEALREQYRWRIESVEPLGSFALTNSLAGFLAPWLVALLGIGLAVLGRPLASRDSWRSLAGVALGSLLIAGCLLLTKSRTAILAVLVGLVLLALYGRVHGWRASWKVPVLGAGVLVVLGLAAVAVGGLDLQVLSEAPLSVRYRLEYWQATATMIADHPWLGVGPGNFQAHYARYALPQASELVADPHNFFLEVWATAGTPALAAMLAVAAAFIWQLAKDPLNLRSTGDQVQLADKAEQIQARSNFDPAQGETNAAWVYGGGMAGLVAGYPLALISGFPLEAVSLAGLRIPVMWLLGLPAAAICLWLLHPWVKRGNMPPALPIVALVVLLTNLLAAGAVGFPGVFGSVWLLLALSLAQNNAAKWRLRAERQSSLILLLAVLGLAVACIQTDFSPVVTAAAHRERGLELMAAGRMAAAEEELLDAAQADPWSREPWQALANLRLEQWIRSHDPGDLAAFDEAAAEFVARDLKHHAAYDAVGNWHLVVWRRSGDQARLERAIEAYEQAVAWYPTKARLRAQLAWTLHLAGQDDQALVQSDKALRLDDLNPHREKKLAAERLVDPRIEGGRLVLHRPESAEQTLRDLRTRIGREKDE